MSVSVICKVIAQIPCFYLYEKYIAQRFDTTVSETAFRDMTHNAALDSALINLRCFNEFFRPANRPDDVRASHFPGVSMQPFLSPNEEQDINKYLAHITVTRSNIVTKPWLIDEMTIRGLRHGVEFLLIIDGGFPLRTESARIELCLVRGIARRLIQEFTKLHESQAD